MSLWEVLVSIFVLTVSVPVMANSETNIQTTISVVEDMTTLHLVESTILEDWQATGEIPKLVSEGGRTYEVSGTTSSVEGCTVEKISIHDPHSEGELQIPQCSSGLFTD